MSDCRNPEGRWPPLEIMHRAKEVDDTGLIPFVDTEAAARHLALSPHSLECYRSLGGGPPFYKFGKFVRYAVPDLEAWTAERRHGQTPGGMRGYTDMHHSHRTPLSKAEPDCCEVSRPCSAGPSAGQGHD